MSNDSAGVKVGQ